MSGARRDERGFVLVGVVIFVIALTIIGLSLFSLSSYEARFLQRSLDGEQAFQSAMGGLERVKFALRETSSLASAGANLPLGDVVSATAIQLQTGNIPDSTGTMHWNAGEPVTIRCTAVVGGGAEAQRRTVEATFTPTTVRGYYNQIITAGSVAVDSMAVAAAPGNPETDRTQTVLLDGMVWDGSSPSDTLDWISRVAHLPVRPILTGSVPIPDVDTWMADLAHTPGSVHQQVGALGNEYRLNGGQIHPQYFGEPSGSPFYRDNDPGNPTIEVKNLAVWVFPHGARFDNPVFVDGHPHGASGCLVIVAGTRGVADALEPADTGLRFFGGLRVDPNISVILVSSGVIYLQHLNNSTGPFSHSECDDIAIFAKRVHLTGPDRTTGHALRLDHSPLVTVPGPLDAPGGYLDLLTAAGALPNATSGWGRSFALNPGTWRTIGP
jgi:hypothetical protein